MEPPHHSAVSGSGSKPFYAPPSFVTKTSAEIISEARASIGTMSSKPKAGAPLRPVNTKRPFTPRERQRTLFGQSQRTAYRPPSAFSLEYLQNQDWESGPRTPPHARRLNPLPPSPSSPLTKGTSSTSQEIERKQPFAVKVLTLDPSELLLPNKAPRFVLPSIPNGNLRSRWPQFRASASLDNLPEEIEQQDEDSPDQGPSGALAGAPDPFPRKAHSSPVQRSRTMEIDLDVHSQYVSREPSQVDRIVEEMNAGGDNASIKSTDSKSKSAKAKNKKSFEIVSGTMQFDEKLDKGEIAVISKPEIKPKSKISKDLKYSQETKKPNKKLKDFGMGEVVQNLVEHKKSTIDRSLGENLNAKTQTKSTAVQNDGKNRKVTTKEIALFDEIILLDGDENPEEIWNDIVNNKKLTVQRILTYLNSLSTKSGNDSEVIATLSRLYECLEKEGSISAKQQSNKQKTQVLRCLYKFVERANEGLLLQIARIILAIGVHGSNLAGVCKLVFKVSRNDQNDKLFLENNTLELFVNALGTASPIEDAEACVYGYGAIKFLTMNNLLLSKVLSLGVLELMVLHIQMINSVKKENSKVLEQTSHALFQLTGALRNVAGEERVFPQFLSNSAVHHLCDSVELFTSDLDVISNVSRTLSILSTDEACCDAIINHKNSLSSFIRLFEQYPSRQDIVVRIGYALGNIMAKNDSARLKLYEQEGAVKCLLNILSVYLEKDRKTINPQDRKTFLDIDRSDGGSSGSIEDVIIKVVRILANMSINPGVGKNLACCPSTMYITNNNEYISPEDDDGEAKPGERFLDILLTILRRKTIEESEELVHSVLSTLNNLSYYPSSKNGVFGERQLEVANALSPLLKTDYQDCLIEVTRVYGNLTRSKETRDFLLQGGDLNIILELLERNNIDLLSTSVGILVNMMADWDKRLAFKSLNGIPRLLKVLEDHGREDWILANLICQAIWNYCIESTNLHAALGPEVINRFIAILVDYIDEEKVFGIAEGAEVNESIAETLDYQQWEEFAGVAINLLEKIESFLDSIDAHSQS